MHTRHLEVRLSPVGLFKGKVIYGAPGDRVPSPVNVHNSKKRKRESQQDDEMPYIKKPPNTFMLSRKEQRPYVLARHKSTDSATVNTIIGKKWRALSENKQEKYYQEAKRLRQLHKQLYPDWSAKENDGQIWKRTRKRGPRDA
ncbi:transcription factor 7-like 2 [Hippoglossus hippoglossus]|uniref:transcription factor 7-like 2 n=1 Tax=Hippoglossus hippoglossus TaxID=8267 RepID=UPI00148CC26F|nr:transcription factor 7-like 2 [Hippoglossus hippoglossus]